MSGDLAYLTTAQAREFIQTTLGDDDLDSLLAAATAEIEEAWGTTGQLIDTLVPRPNARLLRLNHKASSITAVVEDVDGTALSLSADDYELSGTGETLRRLHTGEHPRHGWHGRVRVTYDQPDDMPERIALLVKLVEQDLNYAPGMSSTQIAQWREDQSNSAVWNYRTERDALLRPRAVW